MPPHAAEYPCDDLSVLLHLDRAELPPDLALRTALSCGDAEVSYGDLYSAARGAAAALASSGIDSGDVVALWLTNRPELVELYLGCFPLGAVAMPLFPPMNEHEVRELLGHAEPTLLVTEATVMANCEPGAYTSGTTGIPKGRRTPAPSPCGGDPQPTGARGAHPQRPGPGVPVDRPHLRHARGPDRHADALRNAMIAGDSAPKDLHRRFALRMGLVLQEGYALTETMMVAANPTDRAKVVGSLGQPLPGMSVRIRTAAGVTNEPGISGEIEVRGDTVLSHYYRNEEATQAALVDGWLRTGDLGSLDADGRLWFQGRVKAIIVVGGENIAPAEVAAAFCRHPDVVEAAVVGTHDDTTGQRLVAFVAVRSESGTTAAAVEEFVRGSLTGFKVPGRIELRDSLPKAATGKIDYEALESEARRAT